MTIHREYEVNLVLYSWNKMLLILNDQIWQSVAWKEYPEIFLRRLLTLWFYLHEIHSNKKQDNDHWYIVVTGRETGEILGLMRTISLFRGYLRHIFDRVHETETIKFVQYTTYKRHLNFKIKNIDTKNKISLII